MSLILDALRKSERARQQTLSGQVSSVAPTLSHSSLPTPWVTLLGLILLLNAVVLGFLLWRANQPVTAPSQMRPVSTQPPKAAVKPALRSLAEEVAASEPVTRQPTVTASASGTEVPAATTAMPAKPAATPSTVTESPASAPLLSSLPEAFQQSLPKLQMEVHSYAADPADRFVVINMQRYVAGDTLKEGPHVIAVTSDGVILDYRGTRFMLPRN